MKDDIIGLDILLDGKASWEQVVAFWKEGDFNEELYLVQAIEMYLLTQQQRLTMFNHRLSIEKMLNGRTYLPQTKLKKSIFEQWNKKLGFHYFG